MTTTPSTLDPPALAARFVALTLVKQEWTHAAHLTVGAWHVDRHGAAAALPLLRERIRRLNESHGNVNTATAGYHETITAAYVTLIAAYLEACPPGLPLATRIERMLAGPLAARDVLLTFYSRERLMSTEARAEWVEPDLLPLRLDAVLS
jgi:hypothetical protein